LVRQGLGRRANLQGRREKGGLKKKRVKNRYSWKKGGWGGPTPTDQGKVSQNQRRKRPDNSGKGRRRKSDYERGLKVGHTKKGEPRKERSEEKN